jgi:hypothetical protein
MAAGVSDIVNLTEIQDIERVEPRVTRTRPGVPASIGGVLAHLTCNYLLVSRGFKLRILYFCRVEWKVLACRLRKAPYINGKGDMRAS